MTTAVILIILHTVSGQPVEVNPRFITHLRGPESGIQAFTKDAKCMVNFADGKYITVKETCTEVTRLIEEKRS